MKMEPITRLMMTTKILDFMTFLLSPAQLKKILPENNQAVSGIVAKRWQNNNGRIKSHLTIFHCVMKKPVPIRRHFDGAGSLKRSAITRTRRLSNGHDAVGDRVSGQMRDIVDVQFDHEPLPMFLNCFSA